MWFWIVIVSATLTGTDRPFQSAATAQPESQTARPNQETQGTAAGDVDRWISQSRSAKRHERLKAARALGKIGPAAIPALVRLMNDTAEFVPGRMASALDAYRAEHGEPPPAMLEAMKVEDERWRGDAVSAAFAAIGAGAVPKLSEQLETGDERVQGHAGLSLARIGQPAVSALAKALEHGSASVRRTASRALYEIGADAAAAAPQLIQALAGDDDPVVRQTAALVLAAIKPVPADAAAALVAALEDPHAEVRRRAEEALNKVDPAAASAAAARRAASLDFNNPVAADIPALLRALGDRALNEKATEALARLGPEAAPDVIRMINDRDGTASGHALVVLQRMGPAIVPQLSDALADPQMSVRFICLRALESMEAEAEPAIPAIIQALGEDRMIGITAGKALSAIGRPAIRPLVEVLAGNNQEARERAAEALAAIPMDNVVALAIWVTLLQDGNAKVRSEAAMALRVRVTPRDTSVVEPLVAALADSEYTVRLYSARALGSMAPTSVPAIPALCQLLEDEHPSVRGHAAGALGDMGPQARSALTALFTVYTSADEVFRQSIVAAIQQIDPTAVHRLQPQP